MSEEWYLHKADQCAALAKAATDPSKRSKFESEGRAWREIAAEVGAADRKAIAQQQQQTQPKKKEE